MNFNSDSINTASVLSFVQNMTKIYPAGKLSVIVCFLLLSHSITAQQSPDYHQQVIIRDQPGNPPVNYEILKILSAGSGKPIRNTLFTIETDQSIRSRFNAGTFTFVVTTKPLAVSGDVYYRHVSLASDLYPSNIRYLLKVTASGFQREFPLTAKVKNNNPDQASASFPDTTGRNYSFALSGFAADFSNDDLRRIQDKTRLIDEYFQHVAHLDQHFGLLQTVDPYDYSGFRTIHARLDALWKVYEEVNAKDFQTRLTLSQSDPARLTEKLNAYNGLMQTKRSEVQQVFSTLHLVFFERGLDAMRAAHNQEANDLFHASLELNPAFAPSMLQLARLDFIRRDFEEARCKSDEVLYRMMPDPATRSNTIDLLRNIQETYLDMAKASLRYRQFDKALDEYREAKEICEAYAGIRCTDEVHTGIQNAHKGKYENILQEARGLYNRNDLNGAEQKVEDAYNYHSRYLASTGQPIEARDFEKALKQKRYDNLVRNAINSSEQGKHLNAVNQFISADSLLRLYDLTSNTAAEKAAKTSAQNYISELLQNGQNAVGTNRLNEARGLIRKAGDLQSVFGLQNDKTLSAKIQKLSEQIFGQECINAQASVDSAANAGKLLSSDRDYLKAMKVLDAGLALSNDFSACRLFTDTLENALHRIRDAGTYLELMDLSVREDKAGNYKRALELYLQAGIYFQQQQVSRFNIQHDADLYHYITVNASNGMINYVADQDMYENRLESSFKLYQFLLNRNYSQKLLDGSLYQLGMKQGQADKLSRPGAKAKTLARRYTDGDKRLKRFEKGFIKGYK